VYYLDVMTQGNHSLGENPRATILRIMLEQGRSTRAELGQRTGLSRSAVAKWVADLVEEGLVADVGSEAKGPGTHRGRRSSVLAPVWPAGHVAGIDFGHSHVRVAVADLSGTVLAEQSADADVDNNARNALAMAAQMIGDLMAAIDADPADVREVVAGIPGPIDRSTLTVRSPTILSDWVDLAPAAELERLLRRPVHIENDADLGAWGEARHGAGRGFEHMLYIKASHGIGAGLVINGALYRGAHGFAGEIGHTLLEQDGAWCRCGNRGCLETVLSSSQVRRRLRATGRQDQPVSTTLAGHDDAVSRRVLREAGRVLGRVTAGLCNLLNPEAVIVGGELGLGGDPVLAGVRESIDRCAQPATAEAVKVAAGMLGLRSEVLGAVAMAAARAREALSRP
jgi:predicted NBD/HSP70 family sugar kinase